MPTFKKCSIIDIVQGHKYVYVNGTDQHFHKYVTAVIGINLVNIKIFTLIWSLLLKIFFILLFMWRSIYLHWVTNSNTRFTLISTLVLIGFCNFQVGTYWRKALKECLWVFISERAKTSLLQMFGRFLIYSSNLWKNINSNIPISPAYDNIWE